VKSVVIYLVVVQAGVLFCIPAFAQLNESDTTQFQMRVALTGAAQKGNVDLLVLRGNLELVANNNNGFVFKTQGNSLYQSFGGFKADNDINSRNYFYVNPFHKLYPFAIVYAQTNYRRKIDFRWFGGAGLTWQVVQTPNTVLKLSASVVHENTNFSSTQFNEPHYIGTGTIRLWRSTVYLTGWHGLAHHHLKLFYHAYMQPGFDRVSNNRAQVDIGLDFPVWRGISAFAQYSYIYEQVVAVSVQQFDRILTFGISFQFKK
jgi:hypothetical protein